MNKDNAKYVVGLCTLILLYHGIAQGTEQTEVADELLSKAIDNIVGITGLKESVIVGLMDRQCDEIQAAIKETNND